MCPVPARKVNVQVVSGATMVTYFGLARIMRSAMPTKKSIPPAASMTDAAMITARMISITSMGGEVGVMPNAPMSTVNPTAPQRPKPMPEDRAPIQMAASTTMNCKNIETVIFFSSFSQWRGLTRLNLDHCSNFGLIKFSNENTSSQCCCVISWRSLTTMSCSDLPVS